MATKTSVGRDFQDNLLGRLMTANQVTTIYLRNRMSLRGRILRFDPFVLLLDPLDGSPPQLVYKSAIVSISGPRLPMRRGPGGPRPGGPPRFQRPEGDRRPPYPPRDGDHAPRPRPELG
jgi:RNA chaperone Hfq